MLNCMRLIHFSAEKQRILTILIDGGTKETSLNLTDNTGTQETEVFAKHFKITVKKTTKSRYKCL